MESRSTSVIRRGPRYLVLRGERRRWLATEVLPAIRRTGSYGRPVHVLDIADPNEQRDALFAGAPSPRMRPMSVFVLLNVLHIETINNRSTDRSCVVTVEELAAWTGLAVGTVRKHLRMLEARGLLVDLPVRRIHLAKDLGGDL